MSDPSFDLASGILIFIASVIPIYCSFKLQGKLQVMMIMLGVFAIVHGSYHTLEVLGYIDIAENFVEPISFTVLVIFGLAYLKQKQTRRHITA